MSEFGIGQLVAGRYRIVSILGQGGMGTVYKALDTRIQRLVALKVLRFAPDSEIAEFWGAAAHAIGQEAKALSRLHHPNIVQIYDVGEVDQLLYQALEFVEGRSLQQIIAEGIPLDSSFAVEIIRQVGSALAYAHQQGVIHRDVKPSNILISNNGRVLLSDFGLAIEPGAPTLTQTGTILGTPVYMAPEQAVGKPVDSRSDIFSLGIVAYQCLTNRLPFTGDTDFETLRNLVEHKSAPPRLFNARITAAVENVLMRALAKDPSERFQTADEFSEFLSAAITANADVTLVPAQVEIQSRHASPARAQLTPVPAQAEIQSPVASPAPQTRSPLKSRTLPLLTASLGGAGLLAAALVVWSTGSVKIAGLVALTILVVLTNLASIRLIRRRNGPEPDVSFQRADILLTVQPNPTPTEVGVEPITASSEVDTPYLRSSLRITPYSPEQSRRRETSEESDADQATRRQLPYVPPLIAAAELLQQEPAAMAWLLMLNGPLRGQQFRLNDSTTIGREPSCEVYLADESVSRQHIRVGIMNNRFHIWDAGSANGTFLNGVRLSQEQELRDRDEIRIGNMTLLFIQAVAPAELTTDAKRRLREFDWIWEQLTSSVHHDR